MKRIKLTQNQYALVDDEDFDKLNQYKWCAYHSSTTKSFYAKRRIEKTTTRMHRVIMNAPKGIDVDHINHDTLDNRKENLRLCTRSQNCMNSVHHKNTFSSQYKGVSWDKRDKKWVAHIKINTKAINLGSFVSEIRAAIEYNRAAKKYFKKHALLNNIGDE